MECLVKATLLQHPKITINGDELNLRLKKALALLYYLLVFKEATRMEMAGLLWGDERDELAMRHLRDNLYQIKKAVPIELISTRNKTSLTLNAALRYDIDTDNLLQGEYIEHYSEFLTGFCVPNCYEYNEWLERTRADFLDKHIAVLGNLVRKSSADGNLQNTIYYARQIAAAEPYDEDARTVLMKSYRKAKEYHKAIQTYKDMYRLMQAEMGILPSKTLTELYNQILNEWNDSRQTSLPQKKLIGRRRQELFEKLKSQFQRNAVPSFVLTGSSGVGKSYILNLLLEQLNNTNIRILRAYCFKSKEHDILFAWHSIMREAVNIAVKNNITIPENCLDVLMKLFPEVALCSGKRAKETDSVLLSDLISFESILLFLNIVSDVVPLLLVFEDIQWIDQASLKVIEQILRQLSRNNIAVAMSYRNTAADTVKPLLSQLQEERLLHNYEVCQLTESETMSFIDAYGCTDIPAKTRSDIYRFTAGNPFLIVQFLEGAKESNSYDDIPTDIDSILKYRLSGLDSECQQILDLVATFQNYASVSALEKLTGKAPLELLYICEQLCRRQVLIQINTNDNLYITYSQPEFKDAAYKSIEPIKRRIIHLNIAKMMADEQEQQTAPSLSNEIAYHYAMGGDKFNAFRYKLKWARTYVYLNTSLLGLAKDEERYPDSSAPLFELFKELEEDLSILEREKNNSFELAAMRQTLLYVKGSVCISEGKYDIGVPAVKQILDAPISDEMEDLALEQMIYYGIQVYRTDIIAENIERAVEITQDKPYRYAVNKRYGGYLLVMQGRYYEGIRALENAIGLLTESFNKGQCGDTQLKLQIAYAYNYIAEAYYKLGESKAAVNYYKKAIAEISQCPPSVGHPIFYSNIAIAAFAAEDYALAISSIKISKEFSNSLKAPAWHNQGPASSYNALFAYINGDQQESINSLKYADWVISKIQSPYERGILELVKAILKYKIDTKNTKNNILCQYLNQPYKKYLQNAKKELKDKAGKFEERVIEELSKGTCRILD